MLIEWASGCNNTDPSSDRDVRSSLRVAEVVMMEVNFVTAAFAVLRSVHFAAGRVIG